MQPTEMASSLTWNVIIKNAPLCGAFFRSMANYFLPEIMAQAPIIRKAIKDKRGMVIKLKIKK